MTIKYLVIPGGGPKGFLSVGALEELHDNNIWNINDIESIYATSIGAYISVMIAMKFTWKDIREYMILRPWHECYAINPDRIFNAFQQNGLYDIESVNTFFKPFFNTRDISINVTMEELYDITGVELHFFTIELGSFRAIDVNYKSFPDLPICKAVLMSCAIPMLFTPALYDGKCYVDGGIITNYPLKYCVENVENPDEILGIHYIFCENEDDVEITEDTNILEFMTLFVSKLLASAAEDNKYNITVKHEVFFDNIKSINMDSVNKMVHEQSYREELIQIGICAAKKFMEDHKSIVDDEETIVPDDENTIVESIEDRESFVDTVES